MSYNPSGSGYTPAPGGGPTYTPPGGPASPMVSQAGFQDVLNSWISTLTKPLQGLSSQQWLMGEQVLADEVPRTSQSRIIMSAGAGIVIAAIFGLLGGVLSGHIIGGFLLALITDVIGFALSVGSYYIGAKIMKGTGTVEQQAWVQSTFWAPITALSAIPIVGFIFAILGGLYSLYLSFLMMRAVHRLDSTNAIIAMVIGFVISFIIGIVIAAIVGGILLAIGLGAAATSGALR